MRDLIRRVAPTRLPALVLGPSGIGKELVARAIHAASPRATRPLVPIHCGTVPAELLESELFGHLKGSFTGVTADRPGLIETAHGGTLFLDEIGEMPPAIQVKLLRFLNEGSYQAVGARTPRQADVRIAAATHRDLATAVAEGSFREDLFYRLKGVVLRTPLAERATDVPLLARPFLRRASNGRASFSPDGADRLTSRSWARQRPRIACGHRMRRRAGDSRRGGHHRHFRRPRLRGRRRAVRMRQPRRIPKPARSGCAGTPPHRRGARTYRAQPHPHRARTGAGARRPAQEDGSGGASVISVLQPRPSASRPPAR